MPACVHGGDGGGGQRASERERAYACGRGDIQPISPALAGRFFTTEPPLKPPSYTSNQGFALLKVLSF